MKIAQNFACLALSQAQSEAEKHAIAKDQVWCGDNGYTKYTFADNSVLIQSDPLQYGLNADDADSIKQYAEWLGDDAAYEAAEIERLLAALAGANHA